MFALKFLITCAIFLTINAQNYCSRKLCRGVRHIACNNNGPVIIPLIIENICTYVKIFFSRWAQGCNGHIINMQPFINFIVQLHNKRRNLVASGGLAAFPGAVQMTTMSWDAELARLAVYNALTCRMQHDECRSTKAFHYAVQNLGVRKNRFVNIREFLRKQIREWFNEYNITTVDDIRLYRPRPGPTFQHFTAMVHERNNRIGCAMAEFTFNKDDNTLLVCNYAVANMIGNPIYSIGRPASLCETGINPRYPSLCSVNETFSYNQWLGVG